MKNLDSMSIEELIGTLKVHEQGNQNGKGIDSNSQKDQNTINTQESTSRPTSRSSSKAINTDISSGDESNNEGSDEDGQLAFISRKIRNM